WPGRVAAGKKDTKSLISAVDLLPTLVEIAGAKRPIGYKPDGVNMTRILLGETMPLRNQALFWKFPAPWPAPKTRPDHWVSWAMVQEDWKLVSNRDMTHSKLYRIATDTFEKHDLANQYPEVIMGMMRQLKQWRNTLPKAPSGNIFSSLRKKVTQ
ncbi:N-acetylgalactosamine-6-sulfatase, partial [Verrucomicrobia bacterium]|nr:N-acetylgalactosamine-6-sulfatase [Verrucomicrobiota bacterium]